MSGRVLEKFIVRLRTMSIIIIIVIITSNVIIIGFVIAFPIAIGAHYDELALIKACKIAALSLFIFYTFIHTVYTYSNISMLSIKISFLQFLLYVIIFSFFLPD